MGNLKSGSLVKKDLEEVRIKKKIVTTGTKGNRSKLLFYFSLDVSQGSVIEIWGNCGWREEPTVLISRLLLRMRHVCVASICFDFHKEWMQCTQRIWSREFGSSITRNLITRFLTICHVKLPQSTTLEQKRIAYFFMELVICNSVAKKRWSIPSSSQHWMICK